jgi:tryptophan synthase alpha chain
VSRIDLILTEQRAAGRTTLIPFVTAGYPSLVATGGILAALEASGVRIAELGVAFSDPIADGPVIAASMDAALRSGVRPRDAFELVRRMRPATALGLVAMVSVSIVHRRGPRRFVEEAADAGFDGLIVPDLDLESDAAGEIRDAARGRDVALILLAAPTTAPQRLARIAAESSGFVYLLARAGVTGERGELPELAARVGQVRALTSLPVAAGFGISTPEQVAAVTSCADAAIVGSAFVRRVGQAADPAAAAADLARSLQAALRLREPLRGRPGRPMPGGGTGPRTNHRSSAGALPGPS